MNNTPGSRYPGYSCPPALFVEDLRAIAKGSGWGRAVPFALWFISYVFPLGQAPSFIQCPTDPHQSWPSVQRQTLGLTSVAPRGAVCSLPEPPFTSCLCLDRRGFLSWLQQLLSELCESDHQLWKSPTSQSILCPSTQETLLKQMSIDVILLSVTFHQLPITLRIRWTFSPSMECASPLPFLEKDLCFLTSSKKPPQTPLAGVSSF